MAGFTTSAFLLAALLVGAPPFHPVAEATVDVADDAVWDYLQNEESASTEDPVNLLLRELATLGEDETE